MNMVYHSLSHKKRPFVGIPIFGQIGAVQGWIMPFFWTHVACMVAADCSWWIGGLVRNMSQRCCLNIKVAKWQPGV